MGQGEVVGLGIGPSEYTRVFRSTTSINNTQTPYSLHAYAFILQVTVRGVFFPTHILTST